MRTLEWNTIHQYLRLIDQRQLPERLEFVVCRTVLDIQTAIHQMIVRGAPAIGVTAAFGLALSGINSSADTVADLKAAVQYDAHLLLSARPTAVNLRWALERMLKVLMTANRSVGELRQLLEAEAMKMAEEDVEINRRIATYGADLINDGDTILHHCNTGSLAAVDWGTALGCVRMAFEQGKRVHVLVDETRPRLQGARLTAWELGQYGISYEIITDGAAGWFLSTHQAQKVLFGADRVARNGDVANKIGTYMLALAAHANQVPVYSVFPTSTVDLSLADGSGIIIEERDPQEVLDIQLSGVQATPAGAKARNPAFDVTPFSLLTGLITENGVAYPPFGDTLLALVGRN